MSHSRERASKRNVAFSQWELSLFGELTKVKTEVEWIKRILFLILAAVISNIFLTFLKP